MLEVLNQQTHHQLLGQPQHQLRNSNIKSTMGKSPPAMTSSYNAVLNQKMFLPHRSIPRNRQHQHLGQQQQGDDENKIQPHLPPQFDTTVLNVWSTQPTFNVKSVDYVTQLHKTNHRGGGVNHFGGGVNHLGGVNGRSFDANKAIDEAFHTKNPSTQPEQGVFNQNFKIILIYSIYLCLAYLLNNLI